VELRADETTSLEVQGREFFTASKQRFWRH
jgi:hypothetical protein